MARFSESKNKYLILKEGRGLTSWATTGISLAVFKKFGQSCADASSRDAWGEWGAGCWEKYILTRAESVQVSRWPDEGSSKWKSEIVKRSENATRCLVRSMIHTARQVCTHACNSPVHCKEMEKKTFAWTQIFTSRRQQRLEPASSWVQFTMYFLFRNTMLDIVGCLRMYRQVVLRPSSELFFILTSVPPSTHIVSENDPDRTSIFNPVITKYTKRDVSIITTNHLKTVAQTSHETSYKIMPQTVCNVQHSVFIINRSLSKIYTESHRSLFVANKSTRDPGFLILRNVKHVEI